MPTIAYDIRRMRPGCVIIQAHMGATISNGDFEMHFPVETWLLAPTDDMKLYEVTEKQLDVLSVMTEEHHRKA